LRRTDWLGGQLVLEEKDFSAAFFWRQIGPGVRPGGGSESRFLLLRVALLSANYAGVPLTSTELALSPEALAVVTT
jgi:hypothetical protein